MKTKEEIQVSFYICELITQLEALLQERYFDEFNDIMYELEAERNDRLDMLFSNVKKRTLDRGMDRE